MSPLAKKCLFLTLFTASSMASANSPLNVWEPTPSYSAVNFFSFASFGPVSWVPTAEFGIFEDSETDFNSAPVASFSNGATVLFTQAQNGFDWNVSVSTLTANGTSTSTGTLLGSNHFQLGWLYGKGTADEAWIPQNGSVANPWTPNFWQLYFVNPAGNVSNNATTLFATNIAPSTVVPDNGSPVPLPAAAWSFLTGMIGFLAIRKQRAA